ncbi:hypothetical protein EUGRSUZ_J00098 [Eucalyptus grandis]|uniref:Uncharacterized protein n=2 Tax=Eucalyptus grandis TaxID=71139 RepID=A0ACC3J0Q1_EUCGR|nr:hypothetical protein EUGRSUZ_J00098 [Eucalyptus grandis]
MLSNMNLTTERSWVTVERVIKSEPNDLQCCYIQFFGCTVRTLLTKENPSYNVITRLRRVVAGKSTRVSPKMINGQFIAS